MKKKKPLEIKPLEILEDPGVDAIASVPDVLPKKKTKPIKLHLRPKPPAPADLRAKIVAFWRWGIANEKQIHYAQERPMERVKAPKSLMVLPRKMDCSEFFTDGYAFAGAPDPNGANYNGTGYTGSLIAHGHEIPKGEAQPGDAVIFGPNPGHHVCGILLPGDDPVIVSHGQEKGPLKLRLSAEIPYQPSPVRFFRYLPH